MKTSPRFLKIAGAMLLLTPVAFMSGACDSDAPSPPAGSAGGQAGSTAQAGTGGAANAGISGKGGISAGQSGKAGASAGQGGKAGTSAGQGGKGGASAGKGGNAGGDAGQAGAGSAGQAGSASDPKLTKEQAWLLDETIWHEVPGSEFMKPICRLLEADGTKLPLKPYVWEDCGEGCGRFDVGSTFGRMAPVASTVRDGTTDVPVLALDGGARTEDVYMVRLILRLDEAAVVAAAQLHQMELEQAPDGATYLGCIFGMWPETALSLNVRGYLEQPPSKNKRETWARAPFRPDQKWTWSLPFIDVAALPPGGRYIDLDVGGGKAAACANAPVTVLSLASTEWKPLEGTNSRACAGDGDLIAWSHHDGEAQKLSGWSPKTGVQVLVPKLPDMPASEVSVSPDHIAGILEDGHPDSKPSIFAATRGYSQAEVKLSVSPELNAGGTLSTVRTWGDYVAASVRPYDYPKTPYHLIVLHIPTWKAWRIDGAEGFGIQANGLTLTSTHLFYSEHHKFGGEYEADSPEYADRVVRVELSKLAAFGKPL